MRSPHWLVLAVTSFLLLSGCSGDDSPSRVTIQGDVRVCRSGDDCVVMPAAGARVQVVNVAGDGVVDGSLTHDGTLGADLEPGDYSVKVSLLRLGSANTDVTVQEKDELEVTLNLPPLTVSR